MYIECYECGRIESDMSGQVKHVSGYPVCASCIEAQAYFYCEECSEWQHSDELSEHEKEKICVDCYAQLPSAEGELEELQRGYREGCEF